MISLKELNPNNYPTTKEIAANLNKLLAALNKIRAAYNKPMIINSGLRSMKDHLRIYKEKGIIDPKKIPMNSKHLHGAAADIVDGDGKFYNWCKVNNKLLEEAGLWCEERQGGWQHLQCQPYGSWVPGKTRWFNP